MGSVETELRLGLPGGELESVRGSGKRVFSEIVDLKLKFPAAEKEGGAAVTGGESLTNSAAVEAEKPPAPKAQVVGWPPVRSFRRNALSAQQEKDGGAKEDKSKVGGKAPPSMAAAAAFVKVSMDGAPYLRKVDLRNFQTYQDLSMALEEMFGSFSCADDGRRDGDSHPVRDFMREKRSLGSDYVPTYEDKDGDWMLVGDVPWEMFVNSCKRLRIMRGSDAIGLVPGCKNKE